MPIYNEKKRVELINTICEEMAKGRSLRSVLRDEGMPHHTTFFSWIDDNKERLAQYTGAREARADVIFEQILLISDSQEGDIIKLEDGKEVTNHDVIQRARLRVDSRKWMLGKMQPKKYGEKLDLSSSDGTMTPKADLSSFSTDELIKRAKAAKEIENNAKDKTPD